MTNREKYADRILDIACGGGLIAVDVSGNLVDCEDLPCNECKFKPEEEYGECANSVEKWADSEYKEHKIFDYDRRFLDYVKDYYKWIARDASHDLFLYEEKPSKERCDWMSNYGRMLCISEYRVFFPMVKWEDKEPWLIEDLKKLEVE